MSDTPIGVDPELEAQVLQQETERQEDAGHLSRHPDTGWPKGLKTVVVLVIVAILANTVGWALIYTTGRNVIVTVDCNNADRLGEVTQGLERSGIIKDGVITIKPCDRKAP